MMPMGATHTRPEASAGSPRARARLFAESIVHTRGAFFFLEWGRESGGIGGGLRRAGLGRGDEVGAEHGAES